VHGFPTILLEQVVQGFLLGVGDVDGELVPEKHRAAGGSFQGGGRGVAVSPGQTASPQLDAAKISSHDHHAVGEFSLLDREQDGTARRPVRFTAVVTGFLQIVTESPAPAKTDVTTVVVPIGEFRHHLADDRPAVSACGLGQEARPLDLDLRLTDCGQGQVAVDCGLLFVFVVLKNHRDHIPILDSIVTRMASALQTILRYSAAEAMERPVMVRLWYTGQPRSVKHGPVMWAWVAAIIAVSPGLSWLDLLPGCSETGLAMAAEPRTTLDRPPGRGPIFLLGTVSAGGGASYDGLTRGYGGTILFRPAAAADFWGFLYDWNTAMVWQGGYRSVATNSHLLAADLIFRRYRSSMRQRVRISSWFAGLGIGGTEITFPRANGSSSSDTWFSLVAELGYEYSLRENLLAVLKGQWRRFNHEQLNYSGWSLQFGLGIPLPW